VRGLAGRLGVAACSRAAHAHTTHILSNTQRLPETANTANNARVAGADALKSGIATADIFLPAQRCASAEHAVAMGPSVRPSVCHKPVLYRNG